MLSPFVAIAVGQAHTGYYPPLVAESHFDFEGNLVWNTINQITDLPKNGIFEDGACNAEECVAVGLGVAEVLPHVILTPLIAQKSVQNNSQWNVIPVDNAPSNGKFLRASCSDAFCFAFGVDIQSGLPILARQNPDDQMDWSFVPVSIPSSTQIETATCFEQTCFLVGGDGKFYNASGAPFVLKSDDAGASWQPVTIENNPTGGAFFDIKCNSFLCVAVGQSTQPNTVPIVAQSNDHGASWKIVSVLNAPENGFFYRASCSETRCAAIGSVGVYEKPLLAQTTAPDWQWSVSSVEAAPDQGFFTHVYCSNDFCLAVGGQGSVGDTPLMAKSNGVSSPWKVLSLPKLPMHSRLLSVSCTGDICIAGGSSPYMHAEEPASLLQSLDQGQTWRLVNVKNIPFHGAFYGVSIVK